MNSTMTDSGEFLGIPAAALPNLVKDIYILNFNLVASSTLFFWDTLLNFDKELMYIWKFNCSYNTILFGVIRLLVTVAEIACLLFNVGMWRITDSGCSFNYWMSAVVWLIISTCVDILLIFRVYALYGKNKALLRSLCVLEAAAFVAVACLIAIVLPKIRSSANPFRHQLPNIICVLLDTPDTAPYMWLPILSVQTILFFLALGRHIYIQKSGLTLSNTTSHIYHTFIRDGVWIFFVLLVSILLYIVGVKLHSIVGEAALLWSYSLAGLSASHLIINLRLAIHEAEEQLLPTSLSYTKLTFINGAVLNQSVRTECSHKDL